MYRNQGARLPLLICDKGLHKDWRLAENEPPTETKAAFASKTVRERIRFVREFLAPTTRLRSHRCGNSEFACLPSILRVPLLLLLLFFLRIERKTRRDVHDDPDSTFDAQELARDSHFPRRVFLLISFAALGVLATMAKR